MAKGLPNPAPLFGILFAYYGAGVPALNWTQNPAFGSYSSPVIVGDLAIYGGGDNNVYAYSLNGERSWKIASTGAQIWGSPAISNGRIYIGSADGFLYCISPDGQ